MEGFNYTSMIFISACNNAVHVAVGNASCFLRCRSDFSVSQAKVYEIELQEIDDYIRGIMFQIRFFFSSK